MYIYHIGYDPTVILHTVKKKKKEEDELVQLTDLSLGCVWATLKLHRIVIAL